MTLTKTRLFLSAALVAGVLGVSPSAQATTISGVFNFTGSVRVTAAGVIDFLDDPTATPPTNGFRVVPPETGTFTSTTGTTGTIQDLNAMVEPPGQTLNVPNFITLTALPQLNFTLTMIDPGVYSSAACGAPAAPGQTCTPPNPLPGVSSPFNLANTSVGSTASFSIRGSVTDPAGPPSAYTGLFTTQFIGMSYQDVLATLGSQGFVEASYSATVQTTPGGAIPEPGTTSLLVAGGLLMAARFMRKRSA